MIDLPLVIILPLTGFLNLIRRAITLISLSRLAGTILAQALLLPAAMLIAWVAVHV